jgi:hypothetical protein
MPQLTSARGCKNLVSMGTEEEEWKLARKGLAPAFAQKNIKCAERLQVRMHMFGTVCAVLAGCLPLLVPLTV